MAEAAIGLAASIAAVIGFAGQVIQGCQLLKAAISNVQNAPEDILALKDEVAVIEKSSEVIRALFDRVEFEGVDLDVPLALRQCDTALKSVHEQIDDAHAVFQAKNKRKLARGWQRLKVLSSKYAMKDLMEKLSRVKVQLLAAQSNMIL